MRTFPAYTFEALDRASARDLYWAMELLATARKVTGNDG